ncbi:hypothetical protein SUDANB95_00435 [Actinosynnema sp. ALI-1.44]
MPASTSGDVGQVRQARPGRRRRRARAAGPGGRGRAGAGGQARPGRRRRRARAGRRGRRDRAGRRGRRDRADAGGQARPGRRGRARCVAARGRRGCATWSGRGRLVVFGRVPAGSGRPVGRLGAGRRPPVSILPRRYDNFGGPGVHSANGGGPGTARVPGPRAPVLRVRPVRLTLLTNARCRVNCRPEEWCAKVSLTYRSRYVSGSGGNVRRCAEGSGERLRRPATSGDALPRRQARDGGQAARPFRQAAVLQRVAQALQHRRHLRAHATGGADARDGSAVAAGTTAAATRTAGNDAVDANSFTGPTLPLAVLRCTGGPGAAPGEPIPREKSASPFPSSRTPHRGEFTGWHNAAPAGESG